MLSPAIPRILILAVTLTAAVSAQQTTNAPAARDQLATPAASYAAAIPSYPNTAAGLEKLMKEMLKLAKNGDKQTLANYARSLVLPDAQNWFHSVFGDDLGSQLAMASERARGEIELSAPYMLSDLLKRKLTRIRAALRADDSCDFSPKSTDYPILLQRRQDVPLYSVYFEGGSKDEVTLEYLTYEDNAFRYVGSLKGEKSAAPVGQAGIGRIRVDYAIMTRQLIHSENPKFPSAAKAKHIKDGTVVLRILIGKDGTVQVLDWVEGPCLLAEVAVDAVTKWISKPTLINGQGVEVETTVTVNFALAD